MKNKSLSVANRHLARKKEGAFIANVASSTAIETGKPTTTYIKRAAGRSFKTAPPSPSGSRKKQSS